jgi:hypothetical protein
MGTPKKERYMSRQTRTCPLRNVPMSPADINIEYYYYLYGDRGVSPRCHLFQTGIFDGDMGTSWGQGGVPISNHLFKPYYHLRGHGDM